MHCCRALTLALARFSCTWGDMRQRVCVGHGPGWVLCQVDACSLLLQQWPGPNNDQPYRRIIYFVIFHAMQRRKFHAFIHKKAATSWGTKSHHWHRIPYRGFTPRPRGGSRKIVWEGHIPLRARGARAYNGGLGAEPPAGSRGRAPGGGQGAEAESFLARERPTKPQN